MITVSLQRKMSASFFTSKLLAVYYGIPIAYNKCNLSFSFYNLESQHQSDWVIDAEPLLYTLLNADNIFKRKKERLLCEECFEESDWTARKTSTFEGGSFRFIFFNINMYLLYTIDFLNWTIFDSEICLFTSFICCISPCLKIILYPKITP